MLISDPEAKRLLLFWIFMESVVLNFSTHASGAKVHAIDGKAR